MKYHRLTIMVVGIFLGMLHRGYADPSQVDPDLNRFEYLRDKFVHPGSMSKYSRQKLFEEFEILKDRLLHEGKLISLYFKLKRINFKTPKTLFLKIDKVLGKDKRGLVSVQTTTDKLLVYLCDTVGEMDRWKKFMKEISATQIHLDPEPVMNSLDIEKTKNDKKSINNTMKSK